MPVEKLYIRLLQLCKRYSPAHINTCFLLTKQLDRSLMIGWREGTPKALKGLSSVITLVYLCLWSSYRSQFSTQQPNFLKICSLGLWKKRFFSVFRNFHFWRFYGLFSFFSEFFPLCLCIGHKPPHSTYKYNFWHVGSLWHRKSKKKFLFENFHFWRFESNFWQFYRIFHLMYIVFGIGT